VTIDRSHQYHTKQKVQTIAVTALNLNVRQNRVSESHGFVDCIPSMGVKFRKIRFGVFLKLVSSAVPRMLSIFVDVGGRGDCDILSMILRGYSVSGRKANSSSRRTPKKIAVIQLIQLGLMRSTSPPTASH
jgi:hypothetical protein